VHDYDFWRHFHANNPNTGFDYTVKPLLGANHTASPQSCGGICFVIVGHSYGGAGAIELVDKLQGYADIFRQGQHVSIALLTIDAIKRKRPWPAHTTPPATPVDVFENYYQKSFKASFSGDDIPGAHGHDVTKGVESYISKKGKADPHRWIDNYLAEEKVVHGMTLGEWVQKMADQLAAANSTPWGIPRGNAWEKFRQLRRLELK
jgi:hypothetical protein